MTIPDFEERTVNRTDMWQERGRMYLECEACWLIVEPLDGDGEDGRAERLADLRGGRPAHEVVDGPEVAPLHLVLLRLGPGLAHHLGLRAALPLPRHLSLRRRLSFDEKPKTFSERKRGEFGGDFGGPILVFQRICCYLFLLLVGQTVWLDPK